MIREYMRKSLREFRPYHSPVKPYVAKLDANENPFNHSEEVIQSMHNWINDCSNMRVYPDTDCINLRESIAKHWNINKNNIACGVGGDQLIDCMMKVFLEPEDKVLMPTPSFSMYALTTTMNHGKAVQFLLNDDYSYPIDTIIDMYNKENPKLCILCTPNNPTGNIMDISDIERLLEVIKCPVLIDEAYGEFMEDTMIDKINKYPNIIVLRTFSKAFGAAGLRVGYVIGDKDIIDIVKVGIPPYNLNSFAQQFAIQVLNNYDYYEDIIDKIKQEREWLSEQLKTIDTIDNVYPSHSNFIMIRTNIGGVTEILEEKGVLVRDFKRDALLKNCIRITVGNREHNELLINILNKFQLRISL